VGDLRLSDLCIPIQDRSGASPRSVYHEEGCGMTAPCIMGPGFLNLYLHSRRARCT
jgi:hypothetical protein